MSWALLLKTLSVLGGDGKGTQVTPGGSEKASWRKQHILFYWLNKKDDGVCRLGLSRNWINRMYRDLLCVSGLSHFQLFVTPWTVTHQAPLSMQFFRQEYWSWLPFPTPENLSNPGIEPMPLESPALAGRIFTTVPRRSLWGWPKHLSFSVASGIDLSPTYMTVHFKFQTFKDANVCSIKCEWNRSLPSISCCWQPFSFTIAHLRSLLHQ